MRSTTRCFSHQMGPIVGVIRMQVAPANPGLGRSPEPIHRERSNCRVNSTGESVAERCLRLLLIFLLAVPNVGICQRGNAAEYASLLNTAKQAQARSDYRAAENAYKAAVKLRPDIAELWTNLGLMESTTGSYEDAVGSFRKAIALNPMLFVPNLFLGIDYTRMDRPAEAIPFLVKAERMNSRDPQPPLFMGRAYLLVKDFGAAKRAFLRSIALNGENSSAWFGLGIAALDVVEADGWRLSKEGANTVWAKALMADSLRSQLRLKEAASEVQAVLALDPDFLCAHSLLGFIHLMEKDDSGAAREFDSEAQNCALASLGHVALLANAGENDAALKEISGSWSRDRGFVRSNTSWLAEGIDKEHLPAFLAYLDRVSTSGTADAELSTSLLRALRGTASGDASVFESNSERAEIRIPAGNAEAEYREGRYGQCTDDLSGGMDRRGEPELLLLTGCSFMTGDYRLAATASDWLKKKSPRSMAALYWSVRVNEKFASSAFSRFEQLAPDSERTHLLLGDMYRQRQHYREAEEEYQTAATLSSGDTAPLFGLASAYVHDSNPDGALTVARKALQISPNDADLNMLAADILVSKHKWDMAEEYLKRALDGAKPQQLPRLHVLLGQVYDHTGRTQEAINELKKGIASDEGGEVHYQLGRLYTSIGNEAAAKDAFEKARALAQKKRERAVIALQDSSSSLMGDIP
jgi:tetratricopeptide (TPR) repeat protein